MVRGVLVVPRIACPAHPSNEKEQNLWVMPAIMIIVTTNEENENQLNLPLMPLVAHHPLTPHTKTGVEPAHQSTNQKVKGQIPSQVL